MSDNGRLDVTLNPGDSTQVQDGYYSGGTISASDIETEAKTETVKTNKQLEDGVVIEPTSGKYLSKVTVNFANSIFNVEDATAGPEDIVAYTTAYANTQTVG
jgi:hypothetical protein